MAANSTRSARRRHRHLACLLGAGLAALVHAGPGIATVPIGDQVRMTFTGADGDATSNANDPFAAYNPRARQHLLVYRRTTPAGGSRIAGRLVDEQGNPAGAEFAISGPGREADDPAVVHNPRANEYLVAFARDTATAGEQEIYVQRLSATGAEIGDDIRITRMGPDGDAAFDAQDPAVAYNETRNEYLVAYEADDDTGALVDDEEEIHVQRLAADATEVGVDDQRISDMGPDGDMDRIGADAAIAWNERRDEYMVVWEGADLVDGEFEVYAQRLGGDGTELGPNDRRITDAGPAGNDAYDASDPSIAYNPVTDEYLAAFEYTDDTPPLVEDEQEIAVQRLTYEGEEIGADDRRISDMGPDGSTAHDAFEPRVAVNFRANEYLVAWEGDDAVAPTIEGEYEIHAQRLSATGDEVGGNDVRVSMNPPDGDILAEANDAAVSYDSQLNQYLVAWWADSTVPPLVNDKTEIYARRFGAGTVAGLAAAQCKTLPPLAEPPAGDPSKITLSVEQLLINQRIDQAAIRRANGVQGWLDAGVESRDLCQGIINGTELSAGTVTGYTGVPATLGPPNPRPVVIPSAQPGDPSKVTLTVNQLLINQRISQAAIRRLNALKARLDAGLTGGDIDDGAVGRAQLVAGTRVLFTPVVSPPPAASTTDIAPPSPGDPSKVTLTTTQLLINQRISQAAVKRANVLIHRLGQGIGPEEIKDGSVTGADMVPGLPASTTP